jgi:hypothetical protein
MDVFLGVGRFLASGTTSEPPLQSSVDERRDQGLRGLPNLGCELLYSLPALSFLVLADVGVHQRLKLFTSGQFVCGVESSAFKPVLQLVDAALAAHPGMSSTARVAEVGRTPIDADASEKVTPDTVSAVLALDDHPGPAGRALWGRPDILDVHRLNVSATTHSRGGVVVVHRSRSVAIMCTHVYSAR